MPTLTQKGQVTIPKNVRIALGIHTGDEIGFVVERSRAVLKKKPKKLPFNKWKGYLGNLRTDKVMNELR